MFTPQSLHRNGRRRVPTFAVAALLCVSATELAQAPLVSAAAGGTAAALPALPAAPAPAAPAAAAAPSGESMPVGNLAGWRQIFTDDFTTDVPRGKFPAAVSAKWGAYPSPWTDTSGYGRYSPLKTVSISGGLLKKFIHTENGVPLVAALLPKVPGSSKYGQKYGRYAVRFRSDLLSGYKMAWMLWPDSGIQPRDGEIDFPEKNIASMDNWGFVHHTNASSGGDQAWFKMPMDIRRWHTAVIEWSPNLVVLKLDGAEVGRTTVRVPNTPMHWVLQTEVALTTHAKPPATVKGNLQIDWVAAWAYDPSIGGSSDTTKPTVTLNSPASAAHVSGTVPLTASASDSGGITATKWYVDGVEVAHDGASPWSDTWDSRRVANGPHRVIAKARDAAGNWGTSRSVAVTVNNA